MSVTASTAKSDIDLSMILAFHHGFRRDLWEVAGLAQPSDGWEYFKRQLHVHHTIEDEIIWPAVTAAVREPADLAILQAMDDEHKQIDPALAAVDRAFGTTDGQLEASVSALAQLLSGHLAHEEQDALPMLSRLLGVEQWKAVTKQIRAAVSIKTAPRLLPWMLEGSTPQMQQGVLAILPPPARVLYRLVWRRRYHPAKSWAAPA
jgi:hypothetical protein